ncbi:MAG: hypothetical protein WKF77_12545 [Planctomycetaceae bacterium]
MGTTKATKAADKSQVCRKFVTALHKLYGKSVPKIELPVIETMLFAACLEDNPWAPAEAGLKKLIATFFDLNEIRVSSVNNGRARSAQQGGLERSANSVHSAIYFRIDLFIRLRKAPTTDIGAGCQNVEEDAGRHTVYSRFCAARNSGQPHCVSGWGHADCRKMVGARSGDR